MPMPMMTLTTTRDHHHHHHPSLVEHYYYYYYYYYYQNTDDDHDDNDFPPLAKTVVVVGPGEDGRTTMPLVLLLEIVVAQRHTRTIKYCCSRPFFLCLLFGTCSVFIVDARLSFINLCFVSIDGYHRSKRSTLSLFSSTRVARGFSGHHSPLIL